MKQRLETETKFIGVSFDTLKSQLQKNNAIASETHFERNILFDTPEQTLFTTGRLIRLRTQYYPDRTASLLTFKQPNEHQQQVEKHIRSQQEDETGLTNPEAMVIILEGLGYTPVLCYEKIRQEWHWSDNAGNIADNSSKTIWCFDILPFSEPDCFVLEIEGTARSIEAVMVQFADFGLTKENATHKSYYKLNNGWREKMQLPPSKSFTFSAERLKNIEDMLAIHIPQHTLLQDI